MLKVLYFPVSASHFFIKDVFAAPANGFPFLSTALVAQLDVVPEVLPPSHFLIKAVFAAPASGLPFLPTAFASQLDAVGTVDVLLVDDAAGLWAYTLAEKIVAASAKISFFIAISFFGVRWSNHRANDL